MDDLSQARCNAIARKLNDRPRKRHGFRTPAELFENPVDVAFQSWTCPLVGIQSPMGERHRMTKRHSW